MYTMDANLSRSWATIFPNESEFPIVPDFAIIVYIPTIDVIEINSLRNFVTLKY